MESSNPPTKRQNLPAATTPKGLPPGVWVVATPIGNLADLGGRARQALESADWIACEDTRRTRSLLSALGIPLSGRSSTEVLRRFDRHTPRSVVENWVEELRQSGQSVALVSDAGTPAISDPGALFVEVARSAGIQVTPIPGASAVIALLSVTGWNDVDSFCFQGFFPRDPKTLRQSLERTRKWTAESGRAWGGVWFESPERIDATLGILSETFPKGSGVQLLVCKELTKVHEKQFHGSPEWVRSQVSMEIQNEGAVGEWALAVRFPALDAAAESIQEECLSWSQVLECLIEAGAKSSDAARILSHRFGISRDEVYRSAMEIKKKRSGG